MEKLELIRQAIVMYAVSAVVIFFVVRFIIRAVRLHFAKIEATKYPTAENAMKVYKLLCTFGMAINNHPKTWGEYRNMFYHINQSPAVPSELKQKLKDKLIKKGLYINNMRIIDNYRGDRK